MLDGNLTLPKRPGLGKRGRQIQLITNLYKVSNIPSGEIVQYRVDIVPTVNRNLNWKIMTSLFEKYGNYFENRAPSYDGESIIYTKSPLPIGDGIDIDFVFQEDQRKEQTFRVSLKKVACLQMNVLHEYLRGANIDLPRDCLAAIDIIMRNTPHLKSAFSINQNFFGGRSRDKFDSMTDIWYGYAQSVKAAKGQLLVSMDFVASLFVRSQPAIILLTSALHLKNEGALKRFGKQHRIFIEAELKGLQVNLSHLRNPRKYKIRAVSKENAKEKKFAYEENGQEIQISVERYFAHRYRINLEYPNLPLLEVGSLNRPVYLPIEVCDIIGGQRISRLQPAQTADFIKKMAINPQKRMQKINECFAERNFERDTFLQEYGMKVDKTMMQISMFTFISVHSFIRH
jgi:eukaryotic translation initiation factor 2C